MDTPPDSTNSTQELRNATDAALARVNKNAAQRLHPALHELAVALADERYGAAQTLDSVLRRANHADEVLAIKDSQIDAQRQTIESYKRMAQDRGELPGTGVVRH
jgi:hypothetical protein